MNFNMIKKIIISLLLLTCANLFADNVKLENFIDSSYIDELKKNGTVAFIHEKEDTNLNLVPESLFKEEIFKGLLEKNQKNIPFVAEFLYLIPKKTLIENGSQNFSDISIDDIAKVMRSISKMEGMRYHVTTRNPKGELLYKKSFMIESENSTKKIEDKNDGNANGQISYSYHDDHTYGDIYYKLSYLQSENQLFASFLTTSPMSVIGIKAVEPGNLKISIICIDCKENILLYMLTDTDCKKVSMVNVRKQVKESMTDRMEAIYKWFLMQF